MGRVREKGKGRTGRGDHVRETEGERTKGTQAQNEKLGRKEEFGVGGRLRRAETHQHGLQQVLTTPRGP